MPLKSRRTKAATILSTPENSRGGNGPYMANACQSTATVMNGAAAPASETTARRNAAAAPSRYTSYSLQSNGGRQSGGTLEARPKLVKPPAGGARIPGRENNHGTERRLGEEHAAAGSHRHGRLRQLWRGHGDPARTRR